MLSIRPIKNAKQSGDYYKKAEYYITGEDHLKIEQKGEWYGRGAQKLGLEGEVEKDAFVKLLKGEKEEHAPGLDLTFSPPKSVSIMAQVYGDKRIFEAHTKAVKKILSYAEANCMHIRKMVDGKKEYEQANNITAALFIQYTSRNLDPQLHTHCVIANLAFNGQNEQRTVLLKKLYDERPFLSKLYRFELAYQLTQLGYTLRKLEDKKCEFEIEGIPQSLINVFSSRSQEIKEEAAKYKEVTGELKAKLAITTRKHKKQVDP